MNPTKNKLVTRPAIDVTDLTVAYHEKPVLWDVDFQAPQGMLLAIVGPNGAGKTTLFKLIMKQLEADAGNHTGRRPQSSTAP